MMNEELLRKLHESLAAQAIATVGHRGSAFSLGFWTSEGRQIALDVAETNVDGVVRVSDAGESWSELVMSGYTDPKPTRAERAALQRLCALHGLVWDNDRTEIVCLAKLDEFPEVTHRVTAAAMAVDGWRAWYPDLAKDPAVKADAIVRELVHLGPQTRWEVEPHAKMDGKRRRVWDVGARLRRNHRSAIVSFFPENDRERVVERMLGCVYDVGEPLIAVTSEHIAMELRGASELGQDVVAVPQQTDGTPQLIFSAAERVAQVITPR